MTDNAVTHDSMALQDMRVSDETVDAIYYRMYGISDESTEIGEPGNEIWAAVVRGTIWRARTRTRARLSLQTDRTPVQEDIY